MRRFFLTLWWLLVTPLLGLALLGLWRSPGLASVGVLMGLAYLALCTRMLIAEGYPRRPHPAGSRLGFWFALLLLPLIIPPLLQAQRIWQDGHYTPEPGTLRLLGGLLQLLELPFGHWGPLGGLLAFSLIMAYFLLRIIVAGRR